MCTKSSYYPTTLKIILYSSLHPKFFYYVNLLLPVLKMTTSALTFWITLYYNGQQDNNKNKKNNSTTANVYCTASMHTNMQFVLLLLLCSTNCILAQRKTRAQQLLRWATVWPQQTWAEKWGVAVPLSVGRTGSPSNIMSPEPRPTSIPSGILIHRAVWPQQTWAENWGWGAGLGHCLTQCGLGWGLPPYQVAS